MRGRNGLCEEEEEKAKEAIAPVPPVTLLVHTLQQRVEYYLNVVKCERNAMFLAQRLVNEVRKKQRHEILMKWNNR